MPSHNLSLCSTYILHSNVDNVTDAVRPLPDKTSAVDPMPTSLLKQTADLTSPYIAELFNRSLAAGHLPTGSGRHSLHRSSRKTGLGTTDFGSYRPISNVSLLSKLFKRLVVRQLIGKPYVRRSSTLQSGFYRNRRPPSYVGAALGRQSWRPGSRHSARYDDCI